MKCFIKFLSIFLVFFVLSTSIPIMSIIFASRNKDAETDSTAFADLYMDLPMHYTMKNNDPQFTAQDYNLFESMFIDAGLTFSENGFKRSYFANASKYFDLQNRVTQQNYSLYLKILSVLVIHRKEENSEFGYGYYLSGIRCPNNEQLFIVHYNNDFSAPIFGVLCSSTGEKIWQWKPGEENRNTNRTIDKIYQEIASSLEEKNLSTFIDPLRVLFSAWLWSGYLEKFDIPMIDHVFVPWESEMIPKTGEDLLEQITDHYTIDNTNYSWSDEDTTQILKCLEIAYSERWNQKYMVLTFVRSYTLSKLDHTYIYIPYISVKFKISRTTYGYSFSGLKDSDGSWTFWINDMFYFSDQKVIYSKSTNSVLVHQLPNSDPFIQYLLMVGTFAFQQIDSSYLPVIILAYASSLYDAAQTKKTEPSLMQSSSFRPDSQSMFVPNCESLFRSIVDPMDLLTDNNKLDEIDLASLAKVLVSTGDLQNEPIASFRFVIMKTFRMYNRDTNEMYRLIPYLTAVITFQNGEQITFFEFTALQNEKKDWIVLDASRLWKVAFSSGTVSNDAYFLFDTDELSQIYLAYQLHYSYLIRQQLSWKELYDFTILFSISSWKKYLFTLSLPQEIPSKDHAYAPTLPDLNSLSSYLADHYLLSPEIDFQMSREDKQAIQDIFRERLNERDLPSQDWSTFQISFTTPFQVIGKQGGIIRYFKEIHLSVKGENKSGADSQQSWIRDEQGNWISFSPIQNIESTQGWKIQSIQDISDTKMSAYTTYIGFYARANWEKSVIPNPDIIPLICSLDLRFNTRHYKN